MVNSNPMEAISIYDGLDDTGTHIARIAACKKGTVPVSREFGCPFNVVLTDDDQDVTCVYE